MAEIQVRALETVLASASRALEEDLVNVRSLVLDLLEDLESNIGRQRAVGLRFDLMSFWPWSYSPVQTPPTAAVY